MPLILPGNVASATASTTYDVANSCRFNQPDSAKMSITPASDGNKRTWTWSAWIKIGKPDNFGGIFFAGIAGATDNITDIYLDDDGKLYLRDIVSNGVLEYYVSPNRVFRDHSAWYHIVYAVDTTQGTDTNRVKLYINGTQETSLAENTYPDQNYETNINDSSYAHDLGHGLKTNGNSYYFDGYMAEVCFIDGTQYAASDFGEFDEDSPTIWKPKKVSGLTFGTNGFYLDFEASDNLGNDANGGTDLTETNLDATNQATDTPTNNFATLNPLVNFNSGVFSEGNLAITYGDDTISTIGVTGGRWYWEAERTNASDQAHFGIGCSNGFYSAESILSDGDRIYIRGDASYSGASNIGAISSIGSNDGTEDTFASSTPDILGFYLDLESETKNITIKKNDGETPLVDVDFSYDGSLEVFVFSRMNSGVGASFNFGNPIAALTSANADANGYGSFEFNPTVGGVDYYALCTKNLAEYG
jgi:hypothetical protein